MCARSASVLCLAAEARSATFESQMPARESTPLCLLPKRFTFAFALLGAAALGCSSEPGGSVPLGNGGSGVANGGTAPGTGGNTAHGGAGNSVGNGGGITVPVGGAGASLGAGGTPS